MPSQYPSINDRNFDLLKKIANNTAEMTPDGGVFLTEAEGDARYLQLTGGTVSGQLGINLNSALSTPWFSGPILTGANATNTAWQIDSYAAQACYDIRRANGTKAAPSGLLSGDVIGGLAARGYANGAYTGTIGSFLFTATGDWTVSNYGTIASIAIVPLYQTAQVTAATFGNLSLLSLGNNATFGSWTTNGVVLASIARTYTDRTSTGTVAATCLHGFAASTIAATSATTFTDAANVYIAGDVVQGAGATLTNSYGLWNVGKTRLDGLVGIGVAPQTNISLTIAATLTPSVDTVYGMYGATTAASTTTNALYQFYTNPRTAAAAYTLGTLCHYRAAFPVIGAGSSITTQEGFTAGSGLVGATNNYGFRGMLDVSGTSRYNLYMDGTAPNRLVGALQLSSTNTSGLQLYNTADETTNYERLEFLWDSSTATIRTIKGGTGTNRTLLMGTSLGNSMQVRAANDTSGQFRFFGAASAGANTNYAVFLGTNSATSGANALLALTPTYNQASGTAANTDLLINRTETAIGSGAQYLIDAQVGSVSKFSVDRLGAIAIGNAVAAGVGVASTHKVTVVIGGTTYYLLASNV